MGARYRPASRRVASLDHYEWACPRNLLLDYGLSLRTAAVLRVHGCIDPLNPPSIQGSREKRCGGGQPDTSNNSDAPATSAARSMSTAAHPDVPAGTSLGDRLAGPGWSTAMAQGRSRRSPCQSGVAVPGPISMPSACRCVSVDARAGPVHCGAGGAARSGRPSGSVKRATPSSCNVTANPPSWTTRWCRRHKSTRLSRRVAPPSAQ